MATPRLPVLDKFIVDLRTIWAEDSENERRMGKAKPLLEKLVKDATLKAHSAGWPSTEGRKNLAALRRSGPPFRDQRRCAHAGTNRQRA